MSLSSIEQETIVTFNEGEPTASVYTASKRVAAKLLKAGLVPKQKDKHSWWFEIPKQAVRIKVGRHAIRIGGESLQMAVVGISEGG